MQNKYLRWYNSIISRAQNENRQKGTGEFYESHHITPKSLGGLNSKENLVLLTAKEHFVCHHLLTKFTKGKQKSKMMFAFNCFVFGHGFARDEQRLKTSIRQYEHQKKLLSEYQKQNSALKDKGGNYWKKGKSPEQIQEINQKKGRSGELNNSYGIRRTKEMMKKAKKTRLENNGEYCTNENNGVAINLIVLGKPFKSISKISKHYNISYKRILRQYHNNGVPGIEQLILGEKNAGCS